MGVILDLFGVSRRYAMFRKNAVKVAPSGEWAITMGNEWRLSALVVNGCGEGEWPREDSGPPRFVALPFRETRAVARPLHRPGPASVSVAVDPLHQVGPIKTGTTSWQVHLDP